MSAVFELTTPHGDRYLIYEGGEFERTDMKGFKPSGQWLLTGIRHVQKTRLRVSFETLKTLTPEQLAVYSKPFKTSGNPQWTVEDFDHGSRRVWGNTKHHGIRSIRRVGGEQ